MRKEHSLLVWYAVLKFPYERVYRRVNEAHLMKIITVISMEMEERMAQVMLKELDANINIPAEGSIHIDITSGNRKLQFCKDLFLSTWYSASMWFMIG